MAYEMKIRGTEHEVKVRSPWAVALLPIITLGIYHLVWWYKINKELKAYGEAKGYDLGQNPTNSLLALFPGGLIIIPALITYWNGTKRVQGASKVAGREPVNGWIALLLYLLLSPGMWAYLQVSLNHIWEQEAEALPGQEAPPVSDPMPPAAQQACWLSRVRPTAHPDPYPRFPSTKRPGSAPPRCPRGRGTGRG
jgi:hypothetical protein